MRVSIIIPCYNTGRFVAEAIQSALSQTYPIAEIVVVNDGSTDGSLEIMKSFSGIKVVSQPNRGLSAARNAGLPHVTGDYLVFLDADDRLLPNAVELHLAAFEKNPAAPIVYGSSHLIDAEGHALGDSMQPPTQFGWREVLFGRTPSPSQAMFHRESLGRIGDFDGGVRIGEDFPIYLRLARTADIVCHGAFVVEYRRHPGQLTKRPAALLESIIRSQRAFQATFEDGDRSDQIWDQAERHWRIYWGQWILIEVIRSGLRCEWGRSWASLSTYLRYMPDTITGSARYARDRILGR